MSDVIVIVIAGAVVVGVQVAFGVTTLRRVARVRTEVADDCRTQIAAAEGRAKRAEAQIADAPAQIAELRGVTAELRNVHTDLSAMLVIATERAVGQPRATLYPTPAVTGGGAPAAERDSAPPAAATPGLAAKAPASAEPDVHQRKTVQMGEPPDGCTTEEDDEKTVVATRSDIARAAAQGTTAADNGLRIGGSS